ncbi:MAG: DUF4437 domain-containing protein [Cyanothece sp. SIO2G6]|nr:DUF4437 domain-containing protein [Cyanothece sp. SIO2G6]
MKNIRTFLILVLAFLVTALGSAQVASQTTESVPADLVPADLTAQVVLTAEVEWGPLNPARGDQSPRAATLWGDRTASVPSGFLVQFVDGFSSPPHIHNVTYRGVVIRGLVHNDDPGAANMWLPAGSFWTQPAGDVHITAADANSNLAYIEIEDGPYLVLPTEEAFDNGERPVNVDESNLVWLDASNITWIDQTGVSPSANGPKIAFLWGTPQAGELNGTFVKLPTGFTGTLHSYGSTLRAVVIQGQPSHSLTSGTNAKTLEPGSYFGSTGETRHQVSCETGEACIIYVRAEGTFDVVPASSSPNQNS